MYSTHFSKIQVCHDFFTINIYNTTWAKIYLQFGYKCIRKSQIWDNCEFLCSIRIRSVPSFCQSGSELNFSSDPVTKQLQYVGPTASNEIKLNG